MTDISHEAREIIRRLKEIDYASVIIDHGKVDDAFRQHLAVLNLPSMPIRWVVDLECAYKATEGAAWSVAYSAAWSAAMSSALSARSTGAWSAAWCAAWSEAWNAAYSAAYSVARDTGYRAAARAAFSAAGSAARSAAVSAAKGAAGKSSVVWLPFIDAFEAGLWFYWVMEKEVIAVPRPALSVAEDRLHCETGPAVSWPGGAKYWFWKGTQVTQKIIEAPETLTVKQIDNEGNVEVRRIMIERFGTERYIREGNAVLIATDLVHGNLYWKRRGGDTSIFMLHVRNNTVEPDGTIREFWIRVHPECRPFRARDKWIGEPQEMTPLNARASTWGLTGEVFKHLAEAS